jgi:hypothetical protein
MDSTAGLFLSSTATILLGGALVLTAALLVPRAGLALALGLVAVAVRGYGSQVRTGALTAPPVEASTSGSDSDGEIEVPPRWAVVARRGLMAASVLALVAPALVRNRGHALPPMGTMPGVLALLAAACAGWLMMPVALLAAYAHDDRGPLPPRLALAALVRHPLATLAALLAMPLGMLVTEGLVALLAWQQGQLPLMVIDLFPPPRIQEQDDGKHVYFEFDGTVLDENCSANLESLNHAYPLGLRRGFTLTGTIPPSLSMGLLRVRMDPETYRVDPAAYLTMRILLTVLILWVAAVLLALQARWLGLIAALDSRRPRPPPGTG